MAPVTNDFFGPALVAWWVSVGFGGTGLAVWYHVRGPRLAGLIAGCAAAAASGVVLRALMRQLFQGLADDASIAILTIVLTVVAAYGVYVAQSAENKSRRTEAELGLIASERQRVVELQNSLMATLDTQALALERAQRRGHVLSLKQTILAGMPDEMRAGQANEASLIIRRIVLDAVSREDQSQAKFDCDEAVAVASANDIDLSIVLGKGTLAFLEYHRIVSSGPPIASN